MMPGVFFETIKRRKWVILLALCLVGLADVVFTHLKAESRSVQENKVVEFVEKQYRLLEKGNFRELSENVAEGVWKPESKGFLLNGLMKQGEFERRIEDDLGVRAWRVHFVTLKAVGYAVVAREAFGAQFRRESEILDRVDPSRMIEYVHVVEMSGHNTGRCSIIDWKRKVPVIWRNGKYTVIMRGTPEVYSLIHNEQWFEAVRF